MVTQLATRLVRECDPRLLAKFSWQFGWHGLRAVQRFQKRLAKGQTFPAFLFISLTNRCNLTCQGCWVSPTPPTDLAPETLDRLIAAGKEQGSRFFGLLGGEPLLYPTLFDVLTKHRDCYFQLFTNGTLLTDEAAGKLRRVGNVTPLISIEGLDQVSDERRGGKQVYARALNALAACRRNRLITGVATSVCKSNLHDLVSEEFLRELIHRGAHYVWYYVYRPTGPQPTPELALSASEIRTLRSFMVEARGRFPIIIVDAYWNHHGEALCPAATGISHHINPFGDIEPCPPIQFARDNIGQNGDATRVIRDSQFLQDFRQFAARTTRGCVLLERPDLLKQFLQEHGARDTTGRQTGYAELAAMACRPDHHQPGQEIPEKHWAYRFAKKHWFFGFGAYG